MTAVQDAALTDSPARQPPREAGIPDLPTVALPDFVTPEWLGDQYHLTPGDIRSLSKFLAEHYADWPSERLDRTPDQFFVEIHRLARKWPYFFLDLSQMLEAAVLGKKSYSITLPDKNKKSPSFRKLRRKCMIWNRLARSQERYRETESQGSFHDGDEFGGDDDLFAVMQRIIEETEGQEKSELCWIMNFLSLTSHDWAKNPDIDERVRHWLRRIDCYHNAWPYRHLMSKLLAAPTEPVLSNLAQDARREADRLDREADATFREVKSTFQGLEDARAAIEADPVVDYHDMEDLFFSAEALRHTANHALAEGRAAELHRQLAGEIDEAVQTRTVEEAERLRARLGELGLQGMPPTGFPDAEWERCLEQVAAFRNVSDRTRELQNAAKAAAAAYGQQGTQENFDALNAAMAAANEQPPAKPLFEALDAIEMIVLGLRDTDGDWASERTGLVTMVKRWFEDFETGERASGPKAEGSEDEIASVADADLLEDERKRHRETGDRLALALGELEEARESAETDRRFLDEELSRAKAEIYRLTKLLDKAGSEAAGGNGVPAANGMTVPLPEDVSYGSLPKWAAEHFDGRLALHPRALRALEDAQFDDVELVYRSVELLGTRYWQMRTRSNDSDAPRQEYGEALERLFLEDTPSASGSAMGLARDSFDIDWDGRRLTMDRHLKNRAKARDPRRCFRLYFTWDDVSRSVLIGHLPGHLRTRMS